MPVTPLHYPLAKIIQKLSGKANLSLPALLVGAMVPDFEVPFVYWFSGVWAQDRLVLHSLIGGLTLGTLIAVLLTVYLYPRVVGAVLPVDKKRLAEKCRFSSVLVFSAVIGVFSHVLLDVANHLYNPLFWPFLTLTQTTSPIVPLLGGLSSASMIVHGLMLALFVALCVVYRKDFWTHLLVE